MVINLHQCNYSVNTLVTIIDIDTIAIMFDMFVRRKPYFFDCEVCVHCLQVPSGARFIAFLPHL